MANKTPDSELVLLARKYNRMIYLCKGMQAQLRRMPHKVPMPVPGAQYAKLCIALAEARNHLEYCEHLVQVLSRVHRDQLKDQRPGATPVPTPGLDPASCQTPHRRKENAK